MPVGMEQYDGSFHVAGNDGGNRRALYAKGRGAELAIY